MAQIEKVLLSDNERFELCKMARQVALMSYSPFSNFRVGAAVLGENDKYIGTNIENASYGLTICAERAALAAAIANGDRKIRAIAVACIDAMPESALHEKLPCGACRQWMVELAPMAMIIICGVDRVFSVDELIPLPFRLDSHP
jgi:cytidine deaminase